MMKKILASLLLALTGTAFAASDGVAWGPLPQAEAVGTWRHCRAAPSCSSITA
jgi:hypothetical protein